jgi:hypothetical protein
MTKIPKRLFQMKDMPWFVATDEDVPKLRVPRSEIGPRTDLYERVYAYGSYEDQLPASWL